MPVCNPHGRWPCPDCLKKEYEYCKQDNEKRVKENSPLDENGNLLLHDVGGLKHSLEEMGVIVD